MIVDDYEVLRGDRDDLGSGAAGTVWKGIYIPTQNAVAVKRVKLVEKTQDEKEYARKYIHSEVQILQSLSHKNVVTLFHSKKVGDFLYIFMELCTEGDLATFAKNRALTEILTISFLQDIAQALRCLHTHNPVIIHRDVKPENLLVTATSSVVTGFSIKLTDFGFSCRAPAGSSAFSATCVGTIEWMAPEIRPNRDGCVKYHVQADIFSAGLVFLALINHVCGEVLHALTVEHLSIGEWINFKQRHSLPVTLPAITKASDNALQTIVKKVVKEMIQPEPSERCSIDHVCSIIGQAYASLSSAPATSAGIGQIQTVKQIEGNQNQQSTEGACRSDRAEARGAEGGTGGGASHDAYLRSCLSKYQHAELAKRDILNAFNTYTDLRPNLDAFVFNDGNTKELVCLDGTIPVKYKGGVYNIPVCIWLVNTHPYNPPMVYVKPTASMQIKPGKHADNNGKVYLPYLHEWKHPESDLLGLLQILQIVFGEEMPVFAKK